MGGRFFEGVFKVFPWLFNLFICVFKVFSRFFQRFHVLGFRVSGIRPQGHSKAIQVIGGLLNEEPPFKGLEVP